MYIYVYTYIYVYIYVYTHILVILHSWLSPPCFMAKPFTLFRTWKGFKATPDQDVNPGALGQAVAEPRDPGSAGRFPQLVSSWVAPSWMVYALKILQRTWSSYNESIYWMIRRWSLIVHPIMDHHIFHNENLKRTWMIWGKADTADTFLLMMNIWWTHSPMNLSSGELLVKICLEEMEHTSKCIE